MGGGTGGQHRPMHQVASAEMESVGADLAHHGNEAAEKTDTRIIEITEMNVGNGKTMCQRQRQESAASVPLASVWP